MSAGPYRGIDPSVECAFHPGLPGDERCERCGRRVCDECLVWDEARASCLPCRQHPARVARRLLRPVGAAVAALGALGMSGWFVVTFSARTDRWPWNAFTPSACDRAMLECAAVHCPSLTSAEGTARVLRFFEHQCGQTSFDYANGAAALTLYGGFQHAGELLDEAVRRFPRDAYAFRARAEFVHARRGIASAIDDYAAAFDLAPEAFASDVAGLVAGEQAACPLFDRTLARWRVPRDRSPEFVPWIAQLDARCHPRPARAGRPLTRHSQRLRLGRL